MAEPVEDVVETQEETHEEEAATEEEAASSAVETEQFDVESERARIREQVEAEVTARLAPPKQTEANEPDIEDLMFSDPKAYRAALSQQIKAEILGSIAPTLKAVESDRLVNELGAGLGEHGRKYLRESLGGVPMESIPDGLKDMARRAARDRDREANPQRVTPERSTATGGGEPLVDAETMRIFGKHMAPDQIAKFLKENPQ